MITRPGRPPAWPTLEQALSEGRPVRAVYHGSERVLCPHALGWKNGRPKVLAYQVCGTSQGGLSTDPHQRWRCLFVDEIDDAMITDGPWKTADNYSHDFNCIDDLEIEVG